MGTPYFTFTRAMPLPNTLLWQSIFQDYAFMHLHSRTLVDEAINPQYTVISMASPSCCLACVLAGEGPWPLPQDCHTSQNQSHCRRGDEDVATKFLFCVAPIFAFYRCFFMVGSSLSSASLFISTAVRVPNCAK